MNEQVGWRGFLKTLHEEAPHYATLLPQLPRVLHRRLTSDGSAQHAEMLHKILEQQKRNNTLLTLISLLLLGIVAWSIIVSYAA